MRNTATSLVILFCTIVLVGQRATHQTKEDKKGVLELEALVKWLEAEGEPGGITPRQASKLGLGSKFLPGKEFFLYNYEPQRIVDMVSYRGKTWLVFGKIERTSGVIYLTQADGVLRKALRAEQGYTYMPLTNAMEDFATEKAFWKARLSQSSKP